MLTPSPPGFDQFAARQRRYLLRTAYILTGSREDAEDLVQDALATLFTQWGKIDRHHLAYAKRSLVNRFIDKSRKKQFVTRVLEENDSGTSNESQTAVEDRALLSSLLAPLKPRQRIAVVEKYLNDQSDWAIAQLLECRPATVRSLISRALAAMRASPAAQELIIGR